MRLYSAAKQFNQTVTHQRKYKPDTIHHDNWPGKNDFYLGFIEGIRCAALSKYDPTFSNITKCNGFICGNDFYRAIKLIQKKLI